MTRPSHRKTRSALLVIASMTMMACDGQAKGKKMDQPLPMLDTLIERVRSAGTIDVAGVEDATGATLRQTDDSNASFNFYAADGLRVGDHALGIDLRSPVSGGAATAGALLVLKLSGGCVRRREIEAHYGTLSLDQPPRGDAVGGEAYWSKSEPWGRLSFGFSSKAPECLGSVVLEQGAQR